MQLLTYKYPIKKHVSLQYRNMLLTLFQFRNRNPLESKPIISQITEDFIVESFVKPAVLSRIDPNQFGTIPKSSPIYALLNTWKWGNGQSNFYFKKVFDRVNWIIKFLMQKFLE